LLAKLTKDVILKLKNKIMEAKVIDLEVTCYDNKIAKELGEL
jgi:hypothetical protein